MRDLTNVGETSEATGFAAVPSDIAVDLHSGPSPFRMSVAEIMRDPKREVLKSVFGFDEFRPGQERVVDALLSGRNVLAVMPTGSGKSLCFQVPALVMGGLTIVVSPLLALMQDQVQALRLAGVAADAINSSQDRGENVAIWRRVASGETRLLYLTPERLMTERMLAALAKLDVRLIAIDEAHCISQWGPAFRPEYQALAKLGSVFRGVPIAALTATADEGTRADIAAQLFDGNVETFVLGFDRPNIKISVEPKNDWKRQMLDYVKARHGRSGIVYCLSRKRTEQAAALLNENGIKARAYHAGMTKDEREANQNAFMTEPAMVMAATIAFGMGIDKSDVRFVLHADLPSSLEAYYQEFGRGGRDGATAEAHMLYGLGDMRTRRIFIDQEDAGEERKRREHLRLSALLNYCEAPNCRRQVLLAYFGERAKPCGNCDNCLSPATLVDRTADARLVLNVIEATGSRFGAIHIVDVLLGHESEKVLKFGHDTLPCFGQGAAHKRQDWQSLIRQLGAGGFVDIDASGYGSLIVGAKGRALLRGGIAFSHRPAAPSRKAERKARLETETGGFDDDAQSLLAALKQLRWRLAQQRRVAAYLIFSDRSLIDMAERRPRTREEFAEVNGVGATKLRDFADIFLDAIAAYDRARA